MSFSFVTRGMKICVVGCYDASMLEKYWHCRKRGIQAALARQGDLAGMTRARQRQSFQHRRLETFYRVSIFYACVVLALEAL